MAATLLEVSGLSKRFRGLKAVSDVSFEVPEERIVALIGPNGAGKTTTFNLIAGVFPADEGRVSLRGRPLLGLKPNRICAAGIGRTFQIVKPFGELTVEENVVVGALARESSVAVARRQAQAVLERLGLAAQAARPARSLTLPDRKRLEVARALATRPVLLLLDEVLAGLRPTEVDRMVEVLRELNRSEGLTILMIEHVMRAVMALSDRVVVLDHGEKIADGAPSEVVSDPRVVQSYLGAEEHG